MTNDTILRDPALPDVWIEVGDKGALTLVSAGRPVVCLNGLRVGGHLWTDGTLDRDGTRVSIAYEGHNAEMAVQAEVGLRAGVLRVRFEATVLSTAFWPGNVAVQRTIPHATEPVDAPLQVWQGDPRGGLAVQRAVGHALQWRGPDEAVLLHEIANGDQLLSSPLECHTPAVEVSRGAFSKTYEVVWTACIPELPQGAVSAVAADEPVAVVCRTGRPFHLFDEGERDMSVDLVVWRSSAVADQLSWQVRDMDGRVEAEGHRELTDVELGLTNIRLDLESLQRGPHFVETSLISTGTVVARDRTTVSVLPPLTRRQAPRATPFGLSAFRPGASRCRGFQRADWLDLVRRMGVTRLRHEFVTQDEQRDWGLQQALHHWQASHDHRRPDDSMDIAAHQRRIQSMLADCARVRPPHDEYGNEWNGEGGFLKGGNAKRYVDDYLRPYHAALTESGLPTQLCSQGLAGPDVVWLRAFEEAGGWGLVGAVALHPGRGNFCPDWAPRPDEWVVSPVGSYWNFLGGLRAVRDLRDEFDAKHGKRTHLLLTEVYAPTFPNSWWEDTPRMAAQNVVLTCALALSEDVEAFYWYQLQDGTWFDLDQTNHEDREWHFGLVSIDGALKPAAHAYAIAAELLGEARFMGWLDLPGQLKGLAFEGPNGLVQLVWDRSDGYLLNADHEHEDVHRDAYEVPMDQGGEAFYATPEPWVDPWRRRSSLLVTSAEGGIDVVDCVGRRRHHDGLEIELAVSGEPVFLLGAEPLASLVPRG